MDNEEKLFFRAEEEVERMLEDRKKVFSKGALTGFHCLDQIASFLKNYQTLIYSPPAVGKSVITLDILMAQAEMGKNTCIYSPEFRDRTELMNALIQARLKKCFFGRYGDTVTDAEYMSALKFVSDHFVILIKPRRNKNNTQAKMSIRKMFSEVKKASDYYKIKFDFLLVDPVNYAEKDGDEKFLETQEYVLNMYDQVAEFSERMGLHTILTAHTRDVELVYDKDTGKRYYDVLVPAEIVGGQSNYRAAYQILHFWRAPEGVAHKETGVPYPANYTNIICQKTKPFGVGRLGSTADNTSVMDGLYFDPDTFTMYEIVHGVRYYRNEYYMRQSSMVEDMGIEFNTHAQSYKKEQDQKKKEFFEAEELNDKDGAPRNMTDWGF